MIINILRFFTDLLSDAGQGTETAHMPLNCCVTVSRWMKPSEAAAHCLSVQLSYGYMNADYWAFLWQMICVTPISLSAMEIYNQTQRLVNTENVMSQQALSCPTLVKPVKIVTLHSFSLCFTTVLRVRVSSWGLFDNSLRKICLRKSRVFWPLELYVPETRHTYKWAWLHYLCSVGYNKNKPETHLQTGI